MCLIGKTKIKVNESGVAALALNPTGTVLAAASTKVKKPSNDNLIIGDAD